MNLPFRWTPELGPHLLTLQMILLGSAILGAPPLLAQEASGRSGSWLGLMEVGNSRYQDNDFAGALEAYQEILDAGLESSDLYYNLGNSYI